MSSVHRIMATAAAAGGLALASAACGGGTDTAPVDRAPIVEYRLRVNGAVDPSEPADTDSLDEAAELLQRRLDAVGIEAEVSVSDGAVDVMAYEALDRERAESLSRVGDLEFRAMLEEQQPGAPGETVGAMGPVLLDGEALETAAAVLNPSDVWVLRLSFAEGEGGIDTFNEVATACVERSPRCPTGVLAIVVDGVIVTEPTINSDQFTRDEVEVSGSFDEQRAADLAAILSSGPLPFSLRVD